MPTSAAAAGRSRKKIAEANPTQSGFVVTSAALLATDVYSSEEIQVQKCMARNSPDSRHRPRSRRHSRMISRPALSQAKGARIAAASPSRTAAIAREEAPSACASRIRIEAVETTATAPARTVREIQRGGMARYITPACGNCEISVQRFRWNRKA